MKSQIMTRIFMFVAALLVCGGSLLAQDDGGGPPPGGPPGGFGGGPPGDFDPAKFEQRMMENVRTNLAITSDDEWSAIQPLVQKVMQARREAGGGGGMGMMMRFGGPPGGEGQNGANRSRRFGPPMSEEQEALEKALTENASAQQVKDALSKYRAARKAKQAKLEAAQADLLAVLTPKQEAQAVLMGLLP